MASPKTTTPFIRIDQFGYFEKSRKVAVIVDPQTGYNANDSYTPGIGKNQYQVRRWQDDAIIFSGTLVIWNNGDTHLQSGDKGWWFDFSSLTTSGSYYIYDLGTKKGSYRFEIGKEVYSQVLVQACRMFYYQRCNFPKKLPYAGSKWTDPAAFEGRRQDHHARNRWHKDNETTEKDLSGGWFDAGDLNKYVTLTVEPITQLLETYRLHPESFRENLNLPESKNGIPDILDEVQYEIEWLKKMQDATGTDGLFLKVGSDNFTSYPAPSKDINNRYYLPECSSSTLSGSVVFALASIIYGKLEGPEMSSFSKDLLQRAIKSFNRAEITTANFKTFQSTCDDQNIIAGDADQDSIWQMQCAIAAAAYLYEATGSEKYRRFVELHYRQVEPVGTGWWGPYRMFVQKALLRYSQLPGISVGVSTTITNSKKKTNSWMGLPEYEKGIDLYRAYMPDAQYTWGSNMTRSGCGTIAMDYLNYSIDTNGKYVELAEQHLHWLHGVNPEGIVMLSNMYAYGAERSVNEIFHSWFGHATRYDNAKISSAGPPPGYLTGGPNREYSVKSISPPYNQPVQKSYKDWNTNWNGKIQENSFEITEPAIYYQAMYIELLATLIAANK